MGGAWAAGLRAPLLPPSWEPGPPPAELPWGQLPGHPSLPRSTCWAPRRPDPTGIPRTEALGGAPLRLISLDGLEEPGGGGRGLGGGKATRRNPSPRLVARGVLCCWESGCVGAGACGTPTKR